MRKCVCDNCGGTNVQIKAWVDPNTNEIIEYLNEDNEDTWCEDCGDHTGVTYVDDEHVNV